MGRPFYPQDADDPDLDWLISNFLYERPNYFPVEVGMLPLVLIPFDDANNNDNVAPKDDKISEEQDDESTRKETV